MENHHADGTWESIKRYESADLSELEATTYRLFLHSRMLTGYMGAYAKLNAGAPRDRHLDMLAQKYVGSFGTFAEAVARDTVMDGDERWTVIKRTMLDEERRRMGAIVGAVDTPGITLTGPEEDEIDYLVREIYGDTPYDAVAASEITGLFGDTTSGDIALFRGVIGA